MIYKHTYFYFCKYIQNVLYSEKLRFATIKNGLSYSFITHQIASEEFNYLYSFKFENPGCNFFQTRGLYSQQRHCTEIPRPVLLLCCRKQEDLSWVYIKRSQIHECGTWEQGCAVSFLGIHKSNLLCSVISVVLTVSFVDIIPPLSFQQIVKLALLL